MTKSYFSDDRIVFSCGEKNSNITGSLLPVAGCELGNSVKTCYCDSEFCNSLAYKYESNSILLFCLGIITWIVHVLVVSPKYQTKNYDKIYLDELHIILEQY